jgi:hypothetical protein
VVGNLIGSRSMTTLDSSSIVAGGLGSLGGYGQFDRCSSF